MYLFYFFYFYFYRSSTEPVVQKILTLLEKVDWNDGLSTQFTSAGGVGCLLKILKIHKNLPILSKTITILTKLGPTFEVTGQLMKDSVYFSSLSRCLQLGLDKYLILSAFMGLRGEFQQDWKIFGCGKLSVEILDDKNSSVQQRRVASTMLSFLSLHSHEAVKSLLFHLDDEDVYVVSTCISALSKALVERRGIIPKNSITKIIERQMQIVSLGGYASVKNLFLNTYPMYTERFVELGLIEAAVSFLDTKYTSQDWSSSIDILDKLVDNSQYQTRAISAGAIPLCLKLLQKRLNEHSTPSPFTVVSRLLLDNSMSHKEFVDLGGVTLFAELVAKEKLSVALDILGIVGNNEAMLQVIGSDAALISQLAIILQKKFPDEELIQVALEISLRIISAKIPIHPALAKQVTLCLAEKKDFNFSIPYIVRLTSDPEVAKEILKDSPGLLDEIKDFCMSNLQHSNSLISILLNLSATVPIVNKLEQRKIAQNVPNFLSGFTVLRPLSKDQLLFFQARTDVKNITQEMKEFLVSRIESGDATGVTMQTLNSLALQEAEHNVVDLLQLFETEGKQLLEKDATKSELEEFLVLAIILSCEPKNFTTIVKICIEVQQSQFMKSPNLDSLCSFIHFLGKVFSFLKYSFTKFVQKVSSKR